MGLRWAWTRRRRRRPRPCAAATALRPLRGTFIAIAIPYPFRYMWRYVQLDNRRSLLACQAPRRNGAQAHECAPGGGLGDSAAPKPGPSRLLRSGNPGPRSGNAPLAENWSKARSALPAQRCLTVGARCVLTESAHADTSTSRKLWCLRGIPRVAVRVCKVTRRAQALLRQSVGGICTPCSSLHAAEAEASRSTGA